MPASVSPPIATTASVSAPLQPQDAVQTSPFLQPTPIQPSTTALPNPFLGALSSFSASNASTMGTSTKGHGAGAGANTGVYSSAYPRERLRRAHAQMMNVILQISLPSSTSSHQISTLAPGTEARQPA